MKFMSYLKKTYLSIALIIMFFSSLILISLSIIGEYLRRIFDETRNRPYTIIESKINFDKAWDKDMYTWLRRSLFSI